MSSTTNARLNRLEKKLGEAASARRAYSHRQLVLMAAYLVANDRQEPEDWDTVVGAPAKLLREGEESFAELINRNVEESAVRLERMAAGESGEVV